MSSSAAAEGIRIIGANTTAGTGTHGLATLALSVSNPWTPSRFSGRKHTKDLRALCTFAPREKSGSLRSDRNLPMVDNFDAFCCLLNVKPDERRLLVYFLANLRARKTIEVLLKEKQ